VITFASSDLLTEKGDGHKQLQEEEEGGEGFMPRKEPS
jgi:hypothetical protein